MNLRTRDGRRGCATGALTLWLLASTAAGPASAQDKTTEANTAVANTAVANTAVANTAVANSHANTEAKTAEAQTGAPTVVVPVRRSVRFALGVSFGFLRQEDLGRVTTTEFVPSLVGLAYVKLRPRLYLRPGARLGITGLEQPAAATDARIEQHGLLGRAEAGLLYDAWVIPAVSVGTGLERRSIDFVASGAVQDSGALDRTEWLGSLYVQAGLGVPLFRGFVVVEPYGRLHHTFSDDRSSSELGFDVTFAM